MYFRGARGDTTEKQCSQVLGGKERSGLRCDMMTEKVIVETNGNTGMLSFWSLTCALGKAGTL